MKLWNKIRYNNWKRTLAIFFSLLAVLSSLTGFVLTMIDSGQSSDFTNLVIDILNFIIMMLVGYYLLDGNVRNSNSAYRGVLSYVFIMAMNAVFNALDLIILEIGMGIAGIVLVSFSLVSAIASAVVGFILYRKIIFYLNRSFRAPSYRNVVIWTIVFTLLCLLNVAFIFSLTIISLVQSPLYLGNWGLFFMVLSEAAFPISIVFTVLRLSH